MSEATLTEKEFRQDAALRQRTMTKVGGRLIPFMLLMFAAGVAHLAWMGVLAAIMFVEKATPAGNRVVVPVGVALAALAAIAFWAPGAIPGL